MPRIASFVIAAGLLWAQPAIAQLTDPIPTPITKGNIGVELELVAAGLVAPNYLTHAGDGTNRLFVVDQPGTIELIKDGQLTTEPFLDLSDRLVGISGFDERGLLGLAFHPDFANSSAGGFGKLYTYTSEPISGDADFTVPISGSFNHQSVIAEWQVDAANPDLVDMSTRREILRIDQPQSNHNGGMVAFGPDGNLHIALGDGGGSNDNDAGHGTIGNGQDNTNVLGTLLRIDVDGTDSANGDYGIPGDNPFLGDTEVPDEIFAYGLRNPFRFSFDSQTGDLIVGDAGQNNIEEVDIVTAGGNFGWRLKEGSFAFDPSDGSVSDDLTGLPSGLIDPVLEYDHDEGDAVIGGFVYRGDAIPQLQGKYVFGDFSQRLFWGDLETGEIHEMVIGFDDRDLDLFVKGFGQDADGELYLLGSASGGLDGQTGAVFRIVQIPEPSSACLAALGLLCAGGWAWRRRRRALAGG
ncbi:MAG: PQQ-dependent sugar dehydrogenase [Pirellulales bacterium]